MNTQGTGHASLSIGQDRGNRRSEPWALRPQQGRMRVRVQRYSQGGPAAWCGESPYQAVIFLTLFLRHPPALVSPGSLLDRFRTSIAFAAKLSSRLNSRPGLVGFEAVRYTSAPFSGLFSRSGDRFIRRVALPKNTGNTAAIGPSAGLSPREGCRCRRPQVSRFVVKHGPKSLKGEFGLLEYI